MQEPMVQRYGFFDVNGKEMARTLLTCDVCGTDCFAASYLFENNVDLCPRCFRADASGDRGLRLTNGATDAAFRFPLMRVLHAPIARRVQTLVLLILTPAFTLTTTTPSPAIPGICWCCVPA